MDTVVAYYDAAYLVILGDTPQLLLGSVSRATLTLRTALLRDLCARLMFAKWCCWRAVPATHGEIDRESGIPHHPSRAARRPCRRAHRPLTYCNRLKKAHGSLAVSNVRSCAVRSAAVLARSQRAMASSPRSTAYTPTRPERRKTAEPATRRIYPTAPLARVARTVYQ